MQRDLSVFSVTPAASLLSRCVSRGALSQEEIDFSARQSPAFSSHLQEAEQRIRTQRQLDEVHVSLKSHPVYLSDIQSLIVCIYSRFFFCCCSCSWRRSFCRWRGRAPTSHMFDPSVGVSVVSWLSHDSACAMCLMTPCPAPSARRFQMLQMFCDHLQQLLKEQNRLRQRLMTPLGRTNLPVQAHLHRSVVEVVNVLLDFIDTLEEKLDSVHSCTTTRDRITQLNTSLARLLTQAAELQTLSNQVLQLKEVGRDL
ncbi:putative HAUS augmin-like complex subunit 2 isoform 5 [Scophthalmus maximus]|uniref:Putative HAUS augmin-like complex subunit 2 isoform 5 n=1 Tax=Scophthalmus maximus TaxID=52904 RepID=A0A2U9CH40_SCOMX|nr:putative HAUS augmin-like complex subunit 2 isoform 5 [Scophthalmus maximus]